MILFVPFFPPVELFIHKETSPLPVKSCKFGFMLSINGHRAVRGFAISVVPLKKSVTYSPVTKGLVIELPQLRSVATGIRTYIYLHKSDPFTK